MMRGRELASGKGRSFFGVLSGVPLFLVALVPLKFCPACFPLWGAILGALGLGFLFTGKYFIYTSGFLAFTAVFGLFFLAKRRGEFFPFWIGSFGIAFVLLGKFLLDNIAVVSAGLLFFWLAVLLNFFSRRGSEEFQGKTVNCNCGKLRGGENEKN